MSKKLLELGLLGVITLSLAGCGNDAGDNIRTREDVDNAKTQEFNIDQDKFKDVTGEWVRNFTEKDFYKTGDKLVKAIKKQTDKFGLSDELKEEEKVDTVEGQVSKVKSIYLDNENPDENKIESMQFEVQTIGESGSSGRYQMKVSLKFDGEKAIKDDSFKIQDTNLNKYTNIMIHDKKRDYKTINKNIMDIIKSEKGQGVFVQYVNGLEEEFAVSKDYIVCTLKTKEYKFIQGESDGI